ncbi:MAG TPA: recombinase family protein [Polyangiaceae bacterium]|nr:recombinase family protein [Polyangiaceae bacterium]
MNVAIYARYSSDLQRPASIEDQVRRCTEYVAERGGQVEPSLVFSDAAKSGASLNREGFERLMRAVRERPRRIDAIVVEDMSRVTRDLADATQLFRELRFLEVPLIGVADGVDTSGKEAKVTFTVKSLLSDMYLDELSDKTRRGLEGRALAGRSTGGLPLGYRSVPEQDELGRVSGYKIEIDPDAAAIVRRIFDEYLSGKSQAVIAYGLTRDGIPPPRAKSKLRRVGWVAGTVREIVRNEAYVGNWTFKKKLWVKLPGTNIRRYRDRDPSQVIRREYPERRIIDEETWNAVRARAAAVRARYTGKRSGNTAPGRGTAYPLSGLLFCGCCGATMVVTRGTSALYYRCGDYKKRRTCNNKLGVKEELVRHRIFEALQERLGSPNAVEYLRKRIAAYLGEARREVNRELTDVRGRLARTEQRIAALIRFLADGDRSDYVAVTLRDLEAQARADKAAAAALEAQGSLPIELPTPAVVAERAKNLRLLFGSGDPIQVREALRRYFADGRITLTPNPEGHYVAECRFLPLVALTDPTLETTKPPGRGLRPVENISSCAGRI